MGRRLERIKIGVRDNIAMERNKIPSEIIYGIYGNMEKKK